MNWPKKNAEAALHMHSLATPVMIRVIENTPILKKRWDEAKDMSCFYSTVSVGGNCYHHGWDPDPGDVVRRMLSGNPDPLRVALREWADLMPDEYLATISRYAMVEAEYMEEALADIVAHFRNAEPELILNWLTPWADRREDVSGLLTVLWERTKPVQDGPWSEPDSNIHKPAWEAYGRIDRLGRKIVDRLFEIWPPEKRKGSSSWLLHKAAISSPDSWWAALSQACVDEMEVGES